MTGALLTAIKTFGRNDLRGTYRDPLLVMIVLAPVIWTVAVAVATPAVTDLLAERYDVDLVPYYPLVLTAFLLLTSIIVTGGLAAFLVLEEVDAGTLAALRVTPVPLSTFFAYRAATVVLVTTVYVASTLSFSGILGPGLVPALIPIGQSMSRSDEQLAYYVAQAREVIDLSISAQQGIVEDLRRLHGSEGSVGRPAMASLGGDA